MCERTFVTAFRREKKLERNQMSIVICSFNRHYTTHTHTELSTAMDESYSYNVEWMKPDLKEYLLCDSIYIDNNILRCSTLNYSGQRLNCLLMGASQLTKDFSHSCFACWDFRLISRWLFPQIILARHHQTPGDSAWAFQTAVHIYATGANISLWGLCKLRAGPLHLLPPLRP